MPIKSRTSIGSEALHFTFLHLLHLNTSSPLFLALPLSLSNSPLSHSSLPLVVLIRRLSSLSRLFFPCCCIVCVVLTLVAPPLWNAHSPCSPHLQRVLLIEAQVVGDHRPHHRQHSHLSSPLPIRFHHSSYPKSKVEPSPHSHGNFLNSSSYNYQHFIRI